MQSLRLAFVLLAAAVAVLVASTAMVQADEGRDHIREHMLNIDDTVNDDVYFFSLHDFDSNGYLDGHEIRIALMDSASHRKEQKSLEQVEKRVDAILAHDDKNGDGMLSFQEFRLPQFYVPF